MRLVRLVVVMLAVIALATPTLAQEGAAYRALRSDPVASGAAMALLSPDGSRIAVIDYDGSNELCVREVATYQETFS